MANYTSKYTGAQIDLSVASGSSTTGNISGSSSGTGTFGNLKVMKSSSFGTTAYSTKLVTVKGDISASGDLYLGGNDLKSGTGTTRVTLGATTEFKGNISASGTGHISASGKINSNDEFILKDGSPSGDTLARLYASADDGRLDIYQNNAVKNRINGNGISYIQGGNVAIGTDKAPKLLTVAGDISASGDYYSQTTVNFNQSISSSKDLYLAGSDIFAGTAGTKRLTLGTKNEVFGHISASAGSGITGSRIASTDEIWLKDGALGGDNLARLYASSDDGIFDIYQNNSVKTRLHGNGVSYFQGGNVAIGTSVAPKTLTVEGDISASGGFHVSSSGDVFLKNSRKLFTGTNEGEYIQTDSADRMRFVVGDSQMLLLDQDDGRVNIGFGHKLGVSLGNNTTPPKTLTVAGDISASSDLYVGGGQIYLQQAITNDNFVSYANITDDVRIKSQDINLIAANGVSIGSSDSPANSPKTLTVTGDISGSKDLFIGGKGAHGNTSLSASMNAVTASLQISGGLSDVVIKNLPTIEPTVTGSLWLSGSATTGKSKYLVVFNG